MEQEKPSGKIFDFKILRKLYGFIGAYKGVFYALVLLTLLNAAVTPIRPYLVQQTIDRYIAVNDLRGLTNMAWLMIAALIFQGLVQYAVTYLSGWLGQNIIHNIRVRLYQHLLRFRLRFYDKTPVGRLVTRNISDIETLADVFSEGMAGATGDLLQLLLILGVMLWTDWRLTLVSLSVMPFLLIGTYIFKEKVKTSFVWVRTAVANLNTFVQEHISGMSVVQIFNSEDREYKKFVKINEEHKRANIKSVLYYSVYFPVAEMIGAIATGLLIWYGAKSMIDGTVTQGVLVAFIMYIGMFFRPIRMIADRFNTLQLGIVSTDRILKLLDNQEEIPANGTRIPKELRGDIRFDHVWFAYNGDDYVLKDVSFSVASGKTIALVGATGAGKSSVINLLGRFYDINHGTIFIDGVDVRTYDMHALRRHIGVVLQDVFLFSGSVADNIRLGDTSITDEMIWKAADAVGARSFIERLPGKLQYNVMERGATLSVGQRQLISFIRTMVHDPRIIVLDEATSSVDVETEQVIQQAVEQLMKGRTAVVIAHRLSTIKKADEILVLDRGEIKERGTHERLLEHGAVYANLYRMQYKEAV